MAIPVSKASKGSGGVRRARPANGPVGAQVATQHAAPQAGGAVFAFGDDPSRKLGDFGASIVACALAQIGRSGISSMPAFQTQAVFSLSPVSSLSAER